MLQRLIKCFQRLWTVGGLFSTRQNSSVRIGQPENVRIATILALEIGDQVLDLSLLSEIADQVLDLILLSKNWSLISSAAKRCRNAEKRMTFF